MTGSYSSQRVPEGTGYFFPPGSATFVYGSRLGRQHNAFMELHSDRLFYRTTATFSDERLKTDIEDLTVGLEFVKNLNYIEYKFLGSGSPRRKFGVSAQQVEEVLEDMGIENTSFINIPDYNEEDEESKAGPKYINSNEFLFVLMNAVKELSAKVEDLEAQIAEK
jgi:hypothetical protein